MALEKYKTREEMVEAIKRAIQKSISGKKMLRRIMLKIRLK